jgi:SAM-dependent methyltransferase
MSDTNDKTVQSYDTHIQEYIDGTPQIVEGFVKEWIDTALTDLPKDAKILELGSAFGRDATYIESKGYKVRRTDVTPGFVNLLQSQGHQASILNAITDDLGGPCDLVFADAVLLHFTREEAQVVINKAFEALSANGRFAFSVKQGDGESWSEDKLGAPRYFCYWTKDTIEPLVRQAGFTNIRISDEHKGSNAMWLHIIAEARSSNS